MFITIKECGKPKQEAVDIEMIYSHGGYRFALHRPSNLHPHRNQLWCMSDFETGLLICEGMTKDYVIKKSGKLIDKYIDNVESFRENHLARALFVM